MSKKLRKAIKRLSKELDEAREENRELVEGLAERVTEALERQAEANQALTETLESYLEGQGGDETETAPQEDEDRHEEPEVTEAAERKARELGVDLDDVKGTGSGGRILVKDVEAAAG